MQHVPWAKPSLALQPAHGMIPIGLPAYFQVQFVGGVAPGQLHTIPPALMLGHEVVVRPKALGYRYIYGDGTASELTMDTGGPWPNGRVTHPYPVPGGYQAHVEVLYSVDISVDGSPFQQVPHSVSVPGPSALIRARASHNILVP